MAHERLSLTKGSADNYLTERNFVLWRSGLLGEVVVMEIHPVFTSQVT